MRQSTGGGSKASGWGVKQSIPGGGGTRSSSYCGRYFENRAQEPQYLQQYENIRLFTHTESELWNVFEENSLSVGFNDRVERYGAFAIATDPKTLTTSSKRQGLGAGPGGTSKAWDRAYL